MKIAGILICILIFSCQSKLPFDICNFNHQRMLKNGDTLEIQMYIGNCFPNLGNLTFIVKNDSIDCCLIEFQFGNHDSVVINHTFKMGEQVNVLDSGIRELVNAGAPKNWSGTKLIIYLKHKCVGKYEDKVHTTDQFVSRIKYLFPESQYLQIPKSEPVKPQSFQMKI